MTSAFKLVKRERRKREVDTNALEKGLPIADHKNLTADVWFGFRVPRGFA